MESPILLWTQALALAFNETRAVDDSARLQNPFRTAMLLDEVRFIAPGGFTAGGQVQANLRIGRTPLTNGFVPIGGLSKMILNDGASNGRFTWKLPKPLYVPAGELVSVQLRRQSLDWGGAATIDVSVGFAGRSLSHSHTPPKMLQVPWAASFHVPRLQFGSAARADVSTESDLVNPFNEVLHVQRFIGRGMRGTSTDEFDPASSGATLVRASDSFGRILVRDLTPFTNLFYFGDRSWTVNAKLQPKGFYIFHVERDYFLVRPTATYQGCYITMLGHREVALNP